MKKIKTLLTLTALCVTCSVTGVAIAESKPDNSSLNSVTPEMACVKVSSVHDADLIVNHPVGGESGIKGSIEVNVTLPKAPDTFRIGVMDQNGNKDYLMLWKNNGTYEFAGKHNEDPNVYYGGVASTIQSAFIGEITFKLTISSYGVPSLSCYVPSSNTQMDASVARDQWITIADLGKDGFSWMFLKYGNVESGSALKEVGHPFFYFSSVQYNWIKVEPNSSSTAGTFYDDFSNANTFETNYIKDAEFSEGMAEGKIVLMPSSYQTSTDDNVLSTVKSNAFAEDGSNLVIGTQVFKGANTIDYYVNTTGPSFIFGVKDVGGNVLYISFDFNGYAIKLNGKWIAGDWQSSYWAGILGEDASNFYPDGARNLAAGDMKISLVIDENGDIKICLEFIKLQHGMGYNLSGKKYELATISSAYFAHGFEYGYKVAFGAPTSEWSHVTTLDRITVTSNDNKVVMDDDFSNNNFNQNGGRLWETVDNIHDLPEVDKLLVKDNAVVKFDNANDLGARDVLTVKFNAKINSGDLSLYTGLTESGNVATAKNQVKLNETKYANVSNATLYTVKFFPNGEVMVLADGKWVSTSLQEGVNGYMAFVADDAELTYVSTSVDTIESAPVAEQGKVFVGWNIDGKLYQDDAILGAYFDGWAKIPVYADFGVKDAASLRITGPVGIRFGAELVKEDYDNIVELVGRENVTLGMRVVRGGTHYLDITALNTTLGLVDDVENILYNGVIINISADNYKTLYQGFAYMDITYADGTTQRVWGVQGDNARTVAQVAETLYNKPDANLSDTQKEMLEKFFK